MRQGEVVAIGEIEKVIPRRCHAGGAGGAA
jgi:hypothetical protein